jgi:outer membrane usher protein FimD/PapC
MLSEEDFDYGLGLRLTLKDSYIVSAGYGVRGFSAGAGFVFGNFSASASWGNNQTLDNSYRLGVSYRLLN